MIRIDKFLCDSLGLSRSEAKKAVLSGKVLVNGIKVSRPEAKLSEESDTVIYDGKPVIYEKFVYYMLNKPAGVVSANSDSRDKTCIDLLRDEHKKDLSCVGRLDKDTTGLMIITNDGALVHALTAPSKDIFKDYLVGIPKPLTEDQITALENGVDINDKTPTKPAFVKIPDDTPAGDVDSAQAGDVDSAQTGAAARVILSISEGRFHQVKRMLIAVGSKVVDLKRMSIGGLKLDDSLKPGEYRRLTDGEVEILKSISKQS